MSVTMPRMPVIQARMMVKNCAGGATASEKARPVRHQSAWASGHVYSKCGKQAVTVGLAARDAASRACRNSAMKLLTYTPVAALTTVSMATVVSGERDEVRSGCLTGKRSAVDFDKHVLLSVRCVRK